MDIRLKARQKAPFQAVDAASHALSGVAVMGAFLGALLAAVVAAPANWAAQAVQHLSAGRLQLQGAIGTVWDGQATLVLSAGPGSPERMALPQRLAWRLRPTLGAGAAVELVLDLRHPSLLPQGLQLHMNPGLQSLVGEVRAPVGAGPVVAEVPAAWLVGLGAPWNTLQPSGRLTLQLERLRWESAGGSPAALDLGLRIQMHNMASRVSTLPALGQYEIDLRGGPELAITLSSHPNSALQLEGKGRWRPGSQVEFRGQAFASAGREEALSNLLNIIGRREGTRSLIAIGPQGATAGITPPPARSP